MTEPDLSCLTNPNEPKQSVKHRMPPWPNGLVNCDDFALTLVELKFVRKSTQVFPHRLATQHKLIQVDRKSIVYGA